jgi:hypothetical protein
VLNVAYPFVPVGPDAIGAEQVLTQLDAALVRAGHESIVMASEGSMTEGILLSTPRVSDLVEGDRRKIHEQYRFTLGKFLEKWPIDLIHFHGGDFYEYLPPPGVPVLITLHLPPHRYPPEIFQINRPRTFLHCVSAWQREACPPCANLLPEIEDNSIHAENERGTLERMIEKYFSVYEQLVSDARAAENISTLSEPTVCVA